MNVAMITKNIAQRSRGRPSMFSVALAELICFRLADGESLREICQRQDMPASRAVYQWLARGEREPHTDYGNFLMMYSRAREFQQDKFAEEMLEIADDARNDYIEKFRQNGERYFAFDAENVQRSRLRIDARKWLMSKLSPKKYDIGSCAQMLV